MLPLWNTHLFLAGGRFQWHCYGWYKCFPQWRFYLLWMVTLKPRYISNVYEDFPAGSYGLRRIAVVQVTVTQTVSSIMLIVTIIVSYALENTLVVLSNLLSECAHTTVRSAYRSSTMAVEKALALLWTRLSLPFILPFSCTPATHLPVMT